MAVQNMYEGAVNDFESVITVPVTIAIWDTSKVVTNTAYAGYKILWVMADNANAAVQASTAFSTTGPDTAKSIIWTDWEITVAQATSALTAMTYQVTILAPKNI